MTRYEDDYSVKLTDTEATILEYMSRKLVQYKRPHDQLLLRTLIDQPDLEIADLQHFYKTEYAYIVDPLLAESVVRNLMNVFPITAERKKYVPCQLLERLPSGAYCLNPTFARRIASNSEFFTMVVALLDYGMTHTKTTYAATYADTQFVLNAKYTYEDACRLLNWQQNLNAQNIGGYRYDAYTKTLPVFINYHKEEDAISYDDRFVSENRIIALSKNQRRVDSVDADRIYKRTEEDQENRIYLFVRKNKDDQEAKEFYFLGEIFAHGTPHPVRIGEKHVPAFEIDYRLDVPVRSDIYDYITRENT